MRQKESEDFSLKKLNRKNLKYCKNFDCENEYINSVIRESAIDNPEYTSFIYVDNKKRKVACAYSLSCSGIIASLGGKTYIYPAVEIKYFALDKEYKHKPFKSSFKKIGTYGDVFLANVISSIMDFTDDYCGASRIVLYSVPEAVSFYKRNGFDDFKEFMNPDQSLDVADCVPMYKLI